MIRSTSQRVYDAMSGAQSYIYAYSTLMTRPTDYVIRTVYFRKETVNGQEQDVVLLAPEDIYTIAEVDALFESLRSSIGNLPFTEMVKTGIELSLLNHLNTHVKFGVPVNSGGWEIIS